MLTPIDILKVNLQESEYPYFSDADLQNLLEINDNNISKASWRGCLLKAASDDQVKVGPVESKSSNKEYWNNLAAIYREDYLKENQPKIGYKTSMRRADGC